LDDNYDLSPKNPNKVEVVDNRTPEQIAQEIKDLATDSNRLLDEIIGML
jgi:type I restriction enzyme M protein